MDASLVFEHRETKHYAIMLSFSAFVNYVKIMIQVRYSKDPHMQNSMRKLKLTLTLTLS